METLGEQSFQVDTENILAVVDTNVLLDVFSCHDLAGAYDYLGRTAAVSDPFAVYRRARARESMLLAMYLHRVQAYTYSLREVCRIMLSRVNPDAHDAMETHYAKVFANFVRPRVLNDWKAGMPNEPENDAIGNAADRELVAYAKQHRLPLISNEAFSSTGVANDKMRKRAAAAGVQVFTPKEFYRNHIDEGAEVAEFLRRFQDEAPAYIRAHPEPKSMGDSMDMVEGYFRHILLGETNGETRPVRVVVS